MCGIIGFYGKEKNKQQIEILKQLMIESSIRGLHSFGIAYTSNGKIEVEKSFKLDPNTAVKNFVKNGDHRLIFHCRYSTSGDFKNMNNNQPIKVGKTAIAMNGVISMETKKEFEKQFKVKCDSDNDTEIILRVKRSYTRFLKQNPTVSFAGLFLKRQKIIALRNSKRPLYYFTAAGAEYFTSTIDIAMRSGIELKKIMSVPELVKISK